MKFSMTGQDKGVLFMCCYLFYVKLLFSCLPDSKKKVHASLATFISEINDTLISLIKGNVLLFLVIDSSY
jgi:hypothetical protein